MVRRRAAVAALVALFAAAPGVRAQGQVEARLEPTRTTVGSTVDLVVEVSGGKVADEPALPDLPGLEMLGSSRSSEVRLEGTRLSRRTVFRYTLRAERQGIVRIDPIRVTVDGEPRITPTLRLLVAPGSAAGPAQGEGPVAGAEGGGPPAVFAVTRLDRREAWAGEQLTLSFSFYHDPRLPLGENPDYDPPQTPGLWRVELDDQPRVSTEEVGGRSYRVQTFRYALFPLGPGEYTIGPATVRFSVPDPDRWWMPGHPRTIRTDPLTVEAKPLPGGAPPGFDGAVGRYHLSGGLTDGRATAGVPVELAITVRGDGNPDAIPPPVLPDWPDVTVRDPAVESQTSVDGGTVGGETTFRWLLVPASSGELDLGAARLPYFDPTAGGYVVDSLRLGELAVARGVAPSPAGAGAPPGPTLRAARTPRAPWPRGLAGSPWYWAGLAGPWLAWLGALAAGRVARRRTGARAERRAARKRLREAARGLAEARPNAAEEAARTLREAVAVAWGVRLDGLGPRARRERLAAAGAPRETVTAIEEALDRVAAARYAGPGGPEAARAVEAVADRLGAPPGARAGGVGVIAVSLLAILAVGGAARAAGSAAADSTAGPRAAWTAANAAYRAGDFGTAAGAYRRLLARTPDPRLEADLAAALWRQGRRGEATLHYLRARRLAPRDGAVDADLARLRAELGDPPAASPPAPLDRVRPDEALLLALLASWAALAGLLAARRRPAARPWIGIGGAAAVALAGALAVASARAWSRPRVVALADAPIAARPGGPAIATLPEGALAEALEEGSGAWRIRAPGLPAGWVSRARTARLEAP